VRIAGLGESRGVDGAGADAGDHVEPQPALDDEVLAGADLPAPLRPTARQYQCPAHRGTRWCLVGRELGHALLVERRDALLAGALPTTLARRCVPPSPGSTPRFTSGRPIRPAPCLARRTSHASAISRPPPTVWPLSAAIVSLGVCSSRLSVSLAYSENWYRKRGVTRCIIGMFAPAEKNRSPWPLTTSTYTSSSNRACTMAWSSCCIRSYV